MSTSSSAEPTVGGGGSSSAMPSCTHPAQTIKIGKRFRILRRLGGGAFGEVYVGMDIVTEEYVAMKLEPIITSHQPHLQHEARLYQLLTKGVVTVGVPRLRYYGREGDFNVMVMDLLGPSLEDLYEHCGRKFDVKTTCMLGIQMISRLEFIHAMNYLHRDLKPENFVMGVGRRAHHVYLIDLGLAKRYRDSKTGEHIPYIDGKALTGTARYVSINTHLGQQQARRDDVESVALILIYFVNGGLPWQGVRCQTKLGKYEKIKNLKMNTSPQELCAQIPITFRHLLDYSRSLKFDDAPDYTRARAYLEDLMEERGYEHDFIFQWLLPKTSEESEALMAAAAVAPCNSSGGEVVEDRATQEANQELDRTDNTMGNSCMAENSSAVAASAATNSSSCRSPRLSSRYLLKRNPTSGNLNNILAKSPVDCQTPNTFEEARFEEQFM